MIPLQIMGYRHLGAAHAGGLQPKCCRVQKIHRIDTLPQKTRRPSPAMECRLQTLGRIQFKKRLSKAYGWPTTETQVRKSCPKVSGRPSPKLFISLSSTRCIHPLLDECRHLGKAGGLQPKRKSCPKVHRFVPSPRRPYDVSPLF